MSKKRIERTEAEWMKKMNKKKAVKLVGNIVTIITIIFIIKLVWQMNIDYSLLFNFKNFMWLIILTILYCVIWTLSCIPWLVLVEILANVKLKFLDTYAVFSKSNLLKYVPGNVFQYVGRNELAFHMNIKHSDVALATILDIGILFATGTIFSFLCLGQYVVKELMGYGTDIVQRFWVFILVFFFLLLLILFILRRSLYSKVKKYSLIFQKKNLFRLFFCFLIYALYLFLYACVYIGLLYLIFHVDIDIQNFISLLGATIFSWVLGFIVPGAPGGIGIRELVMTAIAGTILNTETIVVSMILFRILTIACDIIVFILGKYLSTKMKKAEEIKV